MAVPCRPRRATGRALLPGYAGLPCRRRRDSPPYRAGLLATFFILARPPFGKEFRHPLYAFPARLKLNHWALSGNWTVDKQAVVLNEANGRLAYGFHARDLYLVMGPAARGHSVRFRVFIDGQAPGSAHGMDVSDSGNGTLTEPACIS